MATIPLEDSFVDIIGKAQRGLRLPDEELIRQSGISADELLALRGGTVDEKAIRKLAVPLQLGAKALLENARKEWTPHPHQVFGLISFNTVYEDMTVNSYLVWDQKAREGVAFDTGADCAPMLEAVQTNNLELKLILLTHTHADHIAALAKLRADSNAPAFVSDQESIAGATPFAEGRTFTVGDLTIESRRTSGHSVGGTTFVISGLNKPVAIVGDAIFAGSMGGGAVSYQDALDNNRKKILTLSDDTVLCPGHGPLTSVGEEKRHNPFFPEFQT